MEDRTKTSEQVEYNDLGLDLALLQEAQLELLIEFDRICRENNLKYQLFSGTLLGAIRHKGFIPWDDDIDVCMLREDYEKFINISKKSLNEKYFLQTHETQRNYYHSFARIRKNNTLAVQDAFSEFNIHHGIFIDVFPMDNVLPDTINGKIQNTLLNIVKKLKYFKIKKEIINTTIFYKKWLKLSIYYMLKPISIYRFNKLETQISKMFKNKKTKYVTCIADGKPSENWRYMIEKNHFYDVVEGEFENYLFYIPRDYDKVLKKIFGDYMMLPPLNKRIPHHRIIELNFNLSNRINR